MERWSLVFYIWACWRVARGSCRPGWRYRLCLIRVVRTWCWSCWLAFSYSSIIWWRRWEGRISWRNGFYRRRIRRLIRRWRVCRAIVERRWWVLIQLLLRWICRIIARWIRLIWRHYEVPGQERLPQQKSTRNTRKIEKEHWYFARCLLATFSYYLCHVVSWKMTSWSVRRYQPAALSRTFVIVAHLSLRRTKHKKAFKIHELFL